MHAREDWGPILGLADRALTARLKDHGIVLDAVTFRDRLHQYYEQRDKNLQETTYHFVLGQLLSGMGYTDVPESVLRSALDALYEVTQKNWILEEDAVETLNRLLAKNYRLGIFSNAGDDKDVQELIHSFGIQSHFDFILTSAACFYRKPHPRTFEMALAQWNITPQEAVMVGDSLEADIQGARSLDMKAVWITRRAHYKTGEAERIQPNLIIPDLKSLPPALEKWTTDR